MLIHPAKAEYSNFALVEGGFEDVVVYSGECAQLHLASTPLKLKETNISLLNILGLEFANWREADQLAIHKYDRGVELRPTEKLQLSGERGLSPRPPDFKSSALTTRTRSL